MKKIEESIIIDENAIVMKMEHSEIVFTKSENMGKFKGCERHEIIVDPDSEVGELYPALPVTVVVL